LAGLYFAGVNAHPHPERTDDRRPVRSVEPALRGYGKAERTRTIFKTKQETIARFGELTPAMGAEHFTDDLVVQIQALTEVLAVPFPTARGILDIREHEAAVHLDRLPRNLWCTRSRVRVTRFDRH